jgi:PAS domain S-box-containing protein
MYGWMAEEVLGRNISEIVVPEQAREHAAAVRAALNSGQSWTGEFPVKRKDGRQFTALVTDSPIVGSNGELMGIVGVSYDVTAAKRAEEELRRSEEQFKRLANTLPEMCWMARPDGFVSWYNDRWHAYSGKSARELEGWGWQTVHHPEFVLQVTERWKKSLETGERFEMEFPLRGQDGVYRWFLTRAQAFRNSSGEIVSWFGVNTNIDDAVKTRQALSEARRELERRVQERTAELNSANESLRSLSGTLLQLRDEERRRLARDLHDSLGQLIAATGMNLATIRAQQDKLDANAVKAILEIGDLVQEMNRQTRTISHLLHPPLLDEVGLVSALNWYVEEFSSRSGIQVQLEISESFGRISEDLEIAIFRIVQECLTNVHRHSGSLVAAIRVRQLSDQIILEVEDRGRGISADKLSELKTARSRGLGFRGMQERVRHLGGTWEIRSNQNGTVVVATIPFPAKEWAAAAAL